MCLIGRKTVSGHSFVTVLLNAKIQLEKADSFIVSGMQKIEKFNNSLWKMKLKYAGIGFLGGLITGAFLVVMF